MFAFRVCALTLACAAIVGAKKSWFPETQVMEMTREEDFQAGLVLFSLDSKRRTQQEKTMYEICHSASLTLKQYSLHYKQIDCSLKGKGEICKDSASLPRLFVYMRGHQEAIEVPKNVSSREVLLSYVLHPYLTDWDIASLQGREPVIVVGSVERMNTLLADKQDTMVVYLEKLHNEEHAAALEAALVEAQVLVRIVFTFNKELCPKDSCEKKSAHLWFVRFYPELDDESHVYEFGKDKPFARDDIVIFLGINNFPLVVSPSEIKQGFLDDLEKSYADTQPIAFVVAKDKDWSSVQRIILEAAANFRGLCFFVHVDPTHNNKDTLPSPVAKVLKKRSKNSEPMNDSPYLLAVPSKTASEAGSKSVLVENTPLKLSEVEDAVRVAVHRSRKFKQASEDEDNERETDNDIMPTVTSIEARSIVQSAEDLGKHSLVFMCDSECPHAATTAVSRLYRSVQSEDDVANSITMFGMEASEGVPPWEELRELSLPVLAFRHASSDTFSVFDADFTFGNMVLFVEAEARLQLNRVDPDERDKVFSFTGEGSDEDDLAETNDDEVALSSWEVYRKKGVGFIDPNLLTRSELPSAFSDLAEVVLINFASKYASTSVAFNLIFNQAAEKCEEKKRVTFRTVDCTNLHDLCNTHNITFFPTMLIAGSSVKPAVHYTGSLDVDEILRTVKLFLAPVVSEASSQDVDELFAGKLPYHLTGNVSTSFLGVFDEKSMKEKAAFDLVAQEWRGKAYFAVASATAGDKIEGQKPLVLAIKHREAVVDRKPVTGLDSSSMNMFVSESLRPLIGELTPATFVAYRKHNRPLVILFTLKRLDTAEDWMEVTDFSHGADYGDVMPGVLLAVAKLPKNSNLQFCWIKADSTVAASTLYSYIQDSALPALLIIDYQKSAVFHYPEMDPIQFDSISAWVENYQSGQLKPLANLAKGNWGPAKKAYDFLSRWKGLSPSHKGSKDTGKTETPKKQAPSKSKPRTRLPQVKAIDGTGEAEATPEHDEL